MIDTRSTILWATSGITTIFGLMTLNDWAIVAGILAAIGSMISSGINIYYKIKNKGKKDID